MNTPFLTPHSSSPCRLLTAILLPLLTTLGCQLPSFMSAKKDADPSPITMASAEQPGLPKPNNVGSSNGPLSLNSADEHLRLGEQALERGNYQEAQMHFDHVVQKYPDHVKAHHRLGVLADKLGQFAQAEQHYLTALNGDPRNPSLLSDLGYSYFMQGRYADSERYLLDARRYDPNYEKAVANLGLLYASTGRQQEALAVFRQIGGDADAQKIMQQIAGGQFNPAQQFANNSFIDQQSSVVTTQTSVQPATAITPEEMNDATREFLEQMRQAREELRRTEEQYASQQPMPPGYAQPNPAPQHNFAVNDAPPQQPQVGWAQQAPLPHGPQGGPAPQYAGVTPFGGQQRTQPMPPGYVPDSALAAAMATIDYQPHANASGAPIVIGHPDGTHSQRRWPQDTSATTQAGGPMSNGNPQPVPIYTGSTDVQNRSQPQLAQQTPPQTSTQTQSPAGVVTQWSQQPLTQSPSPYGAAPNPNSFSQTVDNARSTNPPSAWAQQFATSVDQSLSSPGMPPSGMIQQAGAGANSRTQQPVEHAYHTQQPGQAQDITLTGQTGATNPSLVPPSLNGNWASPPQSDPSQASMPPQQPAAGNMYEQARREAALLGLTAGPGQVFPYIHQSQRVMPGTDSRINGAQYPAPVRHMPSGLTPPNLNPAFASPQATNLAPANNYQGQPMPTAPAPMNDPNRYSAPASASFSQHEHANYQNSTPPPAADPYQDARAQQSAQLNTLVNQTWGQSPQSPPHGVTPPSSTQQYGSATTYTPQPSPADAAPYRRQTVPSSAAPAGYEAVPTNQYNSPPPTAGAIVIPEPYRAAPQTGSEGQMPSVQGQTTGYPNSGTRSYAAPMIVPGQRR